MCQCSLHLLVSIVIETRKPAHIHVIRIYMVLQLEIVLDIGRDILDNLM